MPHIRAYYGNKVGIGYNANDRKKHNKTPPSIAIKSKAAPLGQFMDSLHNEGTRSAYACAEAQALAKLLNIVSSSVDFSEIRFSCPISDIYLLWEPCRNCSTWLTADGGFAAGRIYKISDNIINLLSPVQKTQKIDLKSETEFPKLK